MNGVWIFLIALALVAVYLKKKGIVQGGFISKMLSSPNRDDEIKKQEDEIKTLGDRVARIDAETNKVILIKENKKRIETLKAKASVSLKALEDAKK